MVLTIAGKPVMIPYSAVNSLPGGANGSPTVPSANAVPSAAQLNNYFTQQYATLPVTQLQSMLKTRTPSDPDYAVISNLVSVDQYSQKAITTYSAMSTSTLAALIPTMTSKTDQSIAVLTLAGEYKAQDANLTTSQMQQRFTASGTTDVERAVLLSLNPNASPYGSTAVVVPNPPKPKSDPLCNGISLGCLTSSLDVQEAPPALNTVAAVLTGAVGSLALMSLAAPLAPVMLTVGITGEVIASTAPAGVLMALGAPAAGAAGGGGGGAASVLIGTLDSL